MYWKGKINLFFLKSINFYSFFKIGNGVVLITLERNHYRNIKMEMTEIVRFSTAGILV